MESRLTDPYTKGAIRLGSGPRERASTCSCSYRTSKRNGSCYTKLQADPPLISYDRQRYSRSYHGEIAPLIRVLQKEPAQQSSEKPQRKVRPFSATTCSKEDFLQAQRLVTSNLISVRGQNVNYHQRPYHLHRVSEGFLMDQIIKSVQDATAEQVSHICANNDFNPAPPCPSPELSEKDFVDPYESSNCTAAEGEVSISKSAGLSDSDHHDTELYPVQEHPQVKNTYIAVKNPPREVTYTSDESGDDSVEEERALFSRKGTKTCLEFKLPTGRDEKNPIEPTGGLLKNDAKNQIIANEKLSSTMNSNSQVQLESKRLDLLNDKADKKPSRFTVSDSQGTVPKRFAKNQSCDYRGYDLSMRPNTRAAPHSKQGNRQRPFSAFPGNISTVQCKTVEFLSEDDIHGAKFHISKRALETMLYMDFLSEKQRLAKEQRENAECNSVETEGKTCDEAGKPVKGGKQVDVPPEMMVTSKPTLPRRGIVSSNIATEAVDNRLEGRRSSGKHTNIGGDTGKQISTGKYKRLETSARKFLEQAEKELCEAKLEQKRSVSMIWRSISGIDAAQAGREKQTDCEGNAEKEREESKCDVKNDNFSVKKDLSIEDIGMNTTLDTTLDRTGRQLEPDRKSHVSEAMVPLSGHESVTCNDGKKKPVRRIRFEEPSKSEKITRPTSAVIQRFINRSRQNHAARSTKTARRVSARPMPSNSASSEDKRRVSVRNRPASATIHKASYRDANLPKTKVVSSKAIEMVPTHKKIQLPGDDIPTAQRDHESDMRRLKTVTPTPPQRPKSAPTRKLKNVPEAFPRDVVQEEQKASDECCEILDACQRKGINISLETLRRALMPPSEMARPYSRQNMPHSSRILSKPTVASEGHS